MKSSSHNVVKEVGFSLLAEGKTVRVRADGYSMYPSIKPGSIVDIEPLVEGQLPAPGEIIAWKRDTGLVVHRLIRIMREEDKFSFITKGDCCANEDNPVVKNQIAGKVVRTENSSGKRIVTGDKLKHKPNYLYNRLLVWLIIRIKRVRSILDRD